MISQPNVGLKKRRRFTALKIHHFLKAKHPELALKCIKLFQCKCLQDAEEVAKIAIGLSVFCTSRGPLVHLLLIHVSLYFQKMLLVIFGCILSNFINVHLVLTRINKKLITRRTDSYTLAYYHNITILVGLEVFFIRLKNALTLRVLIFVKVAHCLLW